MGSHIVDSRFFRDQFGTNEMRRIFSDENLIQKWLDVEAAIAEAEAKLNIIPKEAAEEICRKARFSFMDAEYIKEQIDLTSHPIVPLVRALEKACEKDAGEYVHWGATTQDIMDTGAVLQLKEAFIVVLNDAREIEQILLNLAESHKHTIMMGRTHGQHALPITFGWKVAVWVSEMRRDIERLKESKKRLFVGQLTGAVGTLASLGKIGPEVQKLTMQKLELKVPDIAWHCSRDRFAEFIAVLALLDATCAKIANEISSLQKTEFGELEEPFTKGKVGSSTIAHKRNPMISEGIVALTKIVHANLPLAFQGMIQEHERDMRTWQTEWEYIPEICIMTGAILHQLKRVLSGLVVRAERMKKNFTLSQGLIASEAVMLELAHKIGRQTAHELIYELSMKSFEENISFKTCLMGNSEVTKYLSQKKIDELLDPANYLGLSLLSTNKVIKSVKSARQKEEKKHE